MFINVGLGWILDLCPGRTALRRAGVVGVRREEAAPFWPSIREQTSDGQERRAGREGRSGMFCLPQAARWRSLEKQLCTPGCQNWHSKH